MKNKQIFILVEMIGHYITPYFMLLFLFEIIYCAPVLVFFIDGDDFLYSSLDPYGFYIMILNMHGGFDLLRLRDWVCMHYFIIYLICWELGLIFWVNLFF